MKLIILQSVFLWFMFVKNIILKTNIASADDFIVNFNENFKRYFESEEKLQKFKKHLIKKMKYRIRERLLKNSMLMELLQVKDKEKLRSGIKNKKEKNKINKNLFSDNNLFHKHLMYNYKNYTLLVKNQTSEIINLSIINEGVNFISMKNETKKKKNKSAFRIDFKIQNSSIIINKKSLLDTNHTKDNNYDDKKNKNEEINFKHNLTNKVKNDEIEKYFTTKPLEITKEDFVSLKNPKSELQIPLQNLFHPSIENNFSPNSTIFLNKTNKNYNKRRKANTNLDIFDWSFGDINSNKRVTKFFINLDSKCNIFINDTIYYDKDEYTSNFIDHLVLHNNFDSIEPRAIYSNDVLINYFIFNKKLNMFTVNFENENHKNYTINYEYFANNLIKSQQNKKDFYSNNEKNVNEFLWKFYNENTNSKNLSLEVEFYFTIDKAFMHENVEFNNKMFMYKTLIEDKDTLVFKWNGTLMPYEVKVFESVFPMVFENCQTMTVNFTMILIGAFFVIFIVLILYLLFSSIAKDLN
jgi:hypothetical protein